MKVTAIIRNVDSKYIRGILDLFIKYGIVSIEFSLSEEQRGLECLRIARDEYSKYFEIGVGTITDTSQVDRVKEIGVDFIFTPAYSEELVKYCLHNNVHIIPGVFSPSEIQNGMGYGLTLFKLFPASEMSYGFLKAIKGPFPNVDLMAVGGVNNKNLGEFFKNGYSGAALGSSIVMQNATDDDYSTIESNLIELKKVIGDIK